MKTTNRTTEATGSLVPQLPLNTNGLEGWLWAAACSIRGAMDAPKFKDYILPLVFLKRLSDVFDDEISRLADKFGDLETANELVSDDHSLVRFYLPPDAHWQEIRKLTDGAGQRLTEVMRALAKANPQLEGVVDVVDFNERRRGQRIIEDGELANLTEVLSRQRLGLNDVEPDILGRAYEYLLKKFAEDQGASAGEFFTPKEVGWLIARLLRPQEGMQMYDPACGSAGLLIKAQLSVKKARSSVKRPLQLFGQERNHATYAIAQMNMIVHDMEGEIAIGDTLRNPKFLDRQKLRRFDLVAANPMWNQPGYAPQFYESDQYDRFDFGYPTEGSADWGWLQHILTSLKDSGRAAVVLDAAAMTRGSGADGQNKEKQIRQKFVDGDLVEAVVLLPENIFYNTPAQGLVVLVNRTKPKARTDQVLLIDASDEFIHERPKNVLSQSGADRIVEIFEKWQDVEGVSRAVNKQEIAAKDYNLNPARYVKRATSHISVDLKECLDVIAAARSEANDVDRSIAVVIDALHQNGTAGTPSSWKRHRFGDIAEFQLGRTPPRKMPAFFSPDHGWPWVTITDMADQTSVVETKERVSEEAFREIFRNRVVRKGTLLMSIKLTVGRTAFMGVDGVHNEAIVSITPDEKVVLSEFLFYLLPLIDYRQYQDRAVKGQTINLGKLREMELSLPPVDEQRRIVEILDSLRRLSTIEQTIADDRRRLRNEVVYRMTRGELLTEADG